MAHVRSGLRWKLAVTGGAVLIAALVLATSFSDGLVGAQSSEGTPTTGTSTEAYSIQEIADELAQQLGLDPAVVESALEQVLGANNMDIDIPDIEVEVGASSGLNDLTSALDLPSFFGESSASLNAELDQGMTLAEIAQAHGKTADELSAYLTQQFTDGANSIIDQLISQPAVQSIIEQLINVPLSPQSIMATPTT